MLEVETYTGGIVETNAYLARFPGGTLLVDAPQGVSHWLKSKKVKVDALLLTHQHFDHVLDAAEVKAENRCPIYAWSDFDRDLTLENFFGAMVGSSFSVPEFKVDHLLAGQSHLDVVGCTWQLFHIPGHSQDSVCFWQKESNVLWSGDVIFRGSLGRTDFPGGSFKQLVTGIQQKLWPLPEGTQVYPGHGTPTTLGLERRENPFL